MKAFYSLIKVSPNSISGDNITIGIVLCGDNGVNIKLSERKIRLAESLMMENATLLDFFVKQILHKAEETNKIIEADKILLFETEHSFTSEYFSYLHRYSNNIIQFSSPVSFYEEVTTDSLGKLFVLFVDAEVKPEIVIDESQMIFKSRVEQKLINRVKDKVHTNVHFNEKIIPSLYFNFEMDCIGLNGVFTGAKSLYFNKAIPTIQSQVSHYVTLITEMGRKFNRENNNNFFLVSDEPEQNTKEHHIWANIRELKKIKLITSSDVEQVAEIIEKNNAQTFLSIE